MFSEFNNENKGFTAMKEQYQQMLDEKNKLLHQLENPIPTENQHQNTQTSGKDSLV